MGVGKGIFEKTKKEFEGKRSRSRMEGEERGCNFWVNLGGIWEDL